MITIIVGFLGVLMGLNLRRAHLMAKMNEEEYIRGFQDGLDALVGELKKGDDRGTVSDKDNQTA